MAGNNGSGPLCNVLGTPRQLDDGTLCLCESPLPGPVGIGPSSIQHFGFIGTKMGQEKWFEHRYPNLMEGSRMRMVAIINAWVQNNWGKTQFEDQKQRIAVIGRNFYQNPDNKAILDTKLLPLDVHGSSVTPNRNLLRDDHFERCGDQPQSDWEADKVVGRFIIDVHTPFEITYQSVNRGGKAMETFQWKAVMYIGDTLGFQEGDPGANKIRALLPSSLGDYVLKQAQSKHVIRGEWEISGEGERPVTVTAAPTETKYVVVAGDTLSGLAKRFYGEESLWPILFDANQADIGKNPNVIKPGQRLTIPAKTSLTAEQVSKAKKTHRTCFHFNTIRMPQAR